MLDKSIRYMDIFRIISKKLMIKEEYQLEDSESLKKVMKWIINAQNVSEGGGISAYYSIRKGWNEDYPETTGYLVETLIDYYKLSKNKLYLLAALKAIDWLTKKQLANGSFPCRITYKPIVFDTGQVLHGFCHTYEEYNYERIYDNIYSG